MDFAAEAVNNLVGFRSAVETSGFVAIISSSSMRSLVLLSYVDGILATTGVSSLSSVLVTVVCIVCGALNSVLVCI